jgi:hypothetical protein
MARAYVLRLTASITSELPLVLFGESDENVGAPTFKVLLEGYLLANKFSNRFPDVLQVKRLANGIRIRVFPK